MALWEIKFFFNKCRTIILRKQNPEHASMMVDFTFFVAKLDCVWIVPPSRQLYIRVYKENYREWKRNPYTKAN